MVEANAAELYGFGHAVADTVVGTFALQRSEVPRAFLAMVHRVLKAAGRAFFLVPNRRYHQAFCHATATALVLRALLAVDPAGYKAVTAGTPFPAFPAARLGPA